MKAEVEYSGHGYAFESRIRGHRFMLDSPSAPGSRDQGPSPKEILLSAILGCSGMDVVGQLRKERVVFSRFWMTAEAVARENHPRIFPQIDVIFEFEGEGLNEPDALEKIAKAVSLSLTLYCGVSAMVAPTSPIFYTIRINGEIEGRGEAKF